MNAIANIVGQVLMCTSVVGLMVALVSGAIYETVTPSIWAERVANIGFCIFISAGGRFVLAMFVVVVTS